MANHELEARKTKGATEIEQSRSKAFVESALALSLDTIKTLEFEIADLLVANPESGNAGSGPVLATPGGALGVHAINYVRRKVDERIEEILQTGRSPSSVVVGPIHGGTSSFLERVYQRARDTRDCWARIVHFEAAFAQGETFTQLDLFRFLFREMGITGDVLTNSQLDVHDMKEAFDAWAEAEWRGANRVVLVIDGLDEIFKNAGAVADPLALTNWLQVLRNRASGSTPPYNKLALFVALTGKTWSAAHGSPYATNAGQVELDKFTPQQVASAFAQLDVSIDEQGITDVYHLFHGHPYLTQLFAWSMRDGSSREDATEMALSFRSRYEAHWERMKDEIKFLIGQNYSLKRVLGCVAKVTQLTPEPEPLDEMEDEMWRSYRQALRVFGLVDGPFKSPTLCRFYEAAIEREQS